MLWQLPMLFATLTANRHQTAWQVAGVDTGLPLFKNTPISEAISILRVPTEGQNIVAEYRAIGLTLRRYPLALLRDHFMRRQILTAEEIKHALTDKHVRVAGLVLFRQSPGTAHDTTFITLEDETGQIQLIV
jgi:error-prone DNA polymerase